MDWLSYESTDIDGFKEDDTMFRRLLRLDATPTLLYGADGQQTCTPACISESLRGHHEALVRDSRGVI